LFDFEYVWEIYKRPELVRFGRYTMPMLWGDRLVGRLDARFDRASRTVVVNGIWLEEIGTARRPDFRAALRAGARRLATFLGADYVDASAVSNASLRGAIKVS